MKWESKLDKKSCMPAIKNVLPTSKLPIEPGVFQTYLPYDFKDTIWAPKMFSVSRKLWHPPGIAFFYLSLFPKKNEILKMMIIGCFTPLKFNIAPEKWWLEDYFPIGKVTFQGLR